jgi:hypothetical protein
MQKMGCLPGCKVAGIQDWDRPEKPSPNFAARQFSVPPGTNSRQPSSPSPSSTPTPSSFPPVKFVTIGVAEGLKVPRCRQSSPDCDSQKSRRLQSIEAHTISGFSRMTTRLDGSALPILPRFPNVLFCMGSPFARHESHLLDCCKRALANQASLNKHSEGVDAIGPLVVSERGQYPVRNWNNQAIRTLKCDRIAALVTGAGSSSVVCDPHSPYLVDHALEMSRRLYKTKCKNFVLSLAICFDFS